MCGINGAVSFVHTLDSCAIAAMNKAIEHRGPDNDGIGLYTHCSLGHRRLSVIDLSPDGNQPFLSSDGRFSMVYNGELYNYLEIKSKLTTYKFKSGSDTEVLLAAYLTWGEDCLQHFNGMFAFAIWDKEKNELFVARDRLGIKPLYFYKQDGWFLFSSEVRALLASEIVPRKINKRVLSDYLRYQTVHAPNTMVKHVQMLAPGHFIKINKEAVEIKKYWDFSDAAKKLNDKPVDGIKSDIKDLIYRSVGRRLVSDVPIGAFLSGGIDSSALVGIMSEVSTRKVDTYSIVFDESEFSEAIYSRKMAKLFKTNHHEVKVTPNDFLSLIPQALASMDHPSGDGPNAFVLSKYIKKEGITVAISGLGGDELFCGYRIFKQAHKISGWDKMLLAPKFCRQAFGYGLKKIKPSVSSTKIASLIGGDNFNLETVYPVFRQVILEDDVSNLLDKELIEENMVGLLAKDLSSNIPFLSKVSRLEIATYMQNVLLRDTDQMSMAHALEVRVPFLDHELVSYVAGVPDKIKYPHSPKQLLTDSLDGLLPREIIHRPKMGFVFPWENWLKNELRAFSDEIVNNLAQRDILNGKVVLDLWNRFLKGDERVTWSRVWPLIVLENWLSKNGIE